VLSKAPVSGNVTTALAPSTPGRALIRSISCWKKAVCSRLSHISKAEDPALNVHRQDVRGIEAGLYFQQTDKAFDEESGADK